MASAASRTLRRTLCSGVTSVFFTSCWVRVLPPCRVLPVLASTAPARATPPGVHAGVGVEAAVLGREHALDEHRRKLREGHRAAILLGMQVSQHGAIAVSYTHLRAHETPE